MKKKNLFMLVLILFAVSLLFAEGERETAAAAEKKYTFYHLLWSVTDPNVRWHTKSAESYMRINPEVEIKYVGPEKYDPAEHVKFLDTIIQANPNGIALHISDPDALLPSLREAKRRGIPIISVTSHPPTPEAEAKLKGLYLTWIGADEYLIGYRLGETLQKAIKPAHVAVLMPHVGHAGAEMRAKGFFDSMPKGTKADKVAIGDEPAHAMEVIRSYLAANTDVDGIFTTAALANKWIWDVAEKTGRSGKIRFLTTDALPDSVEAVLAGKFLASFSQEFAIQGQLAWHILYLYNETGMAPVQPIVTGPLVIDKNNVQMIKNVLINFMGEKEYYKLSPW